MSVLHDLTERIGRIEALDDLAAPMAESVHKATRPALVKNALSGTWLGHKLHPLLTDLVIGSWGSAQILDWYGGEDAEGAVDLLTVVGLAASLPTSWSGMADWSDTYGAARRVGVVHSLANLAAEGLFAASLLARRTGRREQARWLGFAGVSVLGLGGYLGGHLSYAQGVGVDHTAFNSGPDEWTATGLAVEELRDGDLRRVRAGEREVLVTRQAGRLLALDNRCTHAGEPLDGGKVEAAGTEDACLTCPWHGSAFRLRDGAVLRGPAATPQPMLDAREADGRIEVRAA